MSVAHNRFAPVGETMFPPRAPFLERPNCRGNLPVPPGPLPGSAIADKPLRGYLEQVDPALDGGEDRRALDRAKRALGER
jgi:hypothetical protein